MKILHVTDNYTPQGGVQQYILGVARLLADHGHSNVVLYTEQTALTIRDGAWPAHHVRTDGDIAAQVQQALVNEQPDVAYIHHVSSPALIDVLASELPAVAYVHGFTAVCPGLAKTFRRGDAVCTRPFGWGCVPMHYLRRCSAARRPSTLARLMRNTAALKQALSKVSRFLVGSRYMADLLAQNGFPADRITLLAPHFLTPGQVPLYEPSQDPNTLLYAGRLEIEKGLPYLLAALQMLPDYVRLVVAGEGTLRGQYEALARELGLAGRVAFLGWLDEEALGQALRRCALVVMPSIVPESFGKSGIDALAQGRPVVAFDVGGIPDWLDDGATGLLARPTDNADLASKIHSLLESPSRQEAMGRAGQRAVAKRYAADRHLSVLEVVLNDAVDAWG